MRIYIPHETVNVITFPCANLDRIDDQSALIHGMAAAVLAYKSLLH